MALEAFKEELLSRKHLNLLAYYAQICRLQKVIQSYFEMLMLG
jgi:hypothetical protein